MSTFIQNLPLLRNIFRRLGIIFVGTIFIWFQFKNSFHPEEFHDQMFEVIMYIMVIIGYGIRFWANGYRKGSLVNGQRDLITWGPYYYIRHPLYLANMIITVGILMSSFCLLDIFILGLFVVISFVYIALREEKVLLSMYGSRYEEYAKNTPRFISKFRLCPDNDTRLFNFKYAFSDIKKMVIVLLFIFIVDTLFENISLIKILFSK